MVDANGAVTRRRFRRAALTDTERLGRKIHFYFGETGTQRSDAELIKAHDWLRRESQAYIDAHKSQICGG